MIQIAPQRSHKINLLAHTALALLDSTDPVQQPRNPISEVSRAAMRVLEIVAWEQEHRPHHEHPLEIEIEDWDLLFCAVKYRLLIAIESQLSTPACRAPDAGERTRAIVRECVAALQQLHRALTQERPESCRIPLAGLGTHVTLRAPDYE